MSGRSLIRGERPLIQGIPWKDPPKEGHQKRARLQTHCDVDTKFVVATLFHLHRRRRIHLHRRRRIRWCNFGATKIVLLAFSAAVLFVCLKMLRGQNAKLFVATLFHLVVVMDCATQLNG